ncbi:MAG: hypothetical protein HY289_13725 [Planctomycetes bacterium]|nr:hypothetical protein [Planctomycetota bacterium]
MKKNTLKSLEKRIAELEERFAQVLQAQPKPGKFKDWRLAIGKYKVTETTKAVDEAGRKIREADRRKTGI